MTAIVRPLTLEQDLKALQAHEYTLRKYRTRGDSRYADGASRSSTEYHQMASKEERAAEAIRARLTTQLGPDGGPGLNLSRPLELARAQARALSTVDDSSSFEAACFYLRHPRWARLVDEYVTATQRWLDSPALEAMKPEYLPVWDSWTD